MKYAAAIIALAFLCGAVTPAHASQILNTASNASVPDEPPPIIIGDQQPVTPPVKPAPAATAKPSADATKNGKATTAQTPDAMQKPVTPHPEAAFAPMTPRPPSLVAPPGRSW